MAFSSMKARWKRFWTLQSIDLLRPAPVEFIQGFDHGEAGEPDAALNSAVLSEMSLSLDEPFEVLYMGPSVFGRFFSERLMLFPDVRKSQVLQVGAQPLGCAGYGGIAFHRRCDGPG